MRVGHVFPPSAQLAQLLLDYTEALVLGGRESLWAHGGEL
jgi:hypothetical protein